MTRPSSSLRIAIFGLSITSSWGNGHATTYRSLVKGLVRRGHEVTFYERRQPWYEVHRDLRSADPCDIVLYNGLDDLAQTWKGAVADADVVIIGSYVPEGCSVAERVLQHCRGICAFYDIDTPVTLATLEAGECAYLSSALIPAFDLYLSFSGGPILDVLEQAYSAREAVPFYCSVDAEEYFPMRTDELYDMAYLGTYSDDRQPKLEQLLNETARRRQEGRFCVAGAKYPQSIRWPENVTRIDHVAPTEHCLFYNSQRFTLNLTRRDMVECGFSPSVRLFEAAACGVPVISDYWAGIDSFFVPEKEILLANSPDDVLRALRDVSAEEARVIGARARARVLREHTSEHRALELEKYVQRVISPFKHILDPDRHAGRPSGATLH